MARGFNYAPGSSSEVEVARSPELSREAALSMLQSRNAVVREVLASRSDLKLGQMVTLAHDRSAAVRAALAANPVVTATVLEHLGTDRNHVVLMALLGNAATPVSVTQRLAAHRAPEVRAAAESRGRANLPK